MQYLEKFFALSLLKNVRIGIRGNEVRVILKRRDVSEPLVFFLKIKFPLSLLAISSRYLSQPLIENNAI